MKTILMSLLLFGSHPALAGASSGSGGFAFANSKQLLQDSIKETIALLDHREEDCINRKMNSIGAPSVSLDGLSEIIRKTRSNFFDERNRTNPDGVAEPLIFDYGSDENGPYIEALKLFFVGFMTYQSNGPGSINLRDLTNKLLLHEASHHFGYEEDQAEKFTEVLTNVNWPTPPPCWKQ